MITPENLYSNDETLTEEEMQIVEIAVASVSHVSEPPKTIVLPDPVILPVRDVDVTRNARDATGMEALLRVFRDHEPNSKPMMFVDFVVQHTVDGKWRRGLVPIVDVDFTKLAEAGMRAQEEYARLVQQWESSPKEGRDSVFPSGRRVPPRESGQKVEATPPAPRPAQPVQPPKKEKQGPRTQVAAPPQPAPKPVPAPAPKKAGPRIIVVSD